MKRDKRVLYSFISAGVFAVSLFGSCSAGKKTASMPGSTNSTKGKPYCSNIPMQGDAPVVNWYIAKVNKDQLSAAFSLPSDYDVYELDTASLSAFFTYANAHQQKMSFNIPLPGGMGCQPFVVAATGTMAGSLAGQYPDIASLKGNSPNDKGADIRLNYGNKQMNASVTWNGINYFVAPAQAMGRVVYIVYDKVNGTQKAMNTKFNAQPPVLHSGGLRTTDR